MDSAPSHAAAAAGGPAPAAAPSSTPQPAPASLFTAERGASEPLLSSALSLAPALLTPPQTAWGRLRSALGGGPAPAAYSVLGQEDDHDHDLHHVPPTPSLPSPPPPLSPQRFFQEGSCWDAAHHHVLAAYTLLWDNGTACQLLASLIFALSALLIKLLHGQVPVFQIVVVRSSLSLTVLVLAGRAMGVSPLLGARRNWGVLVLRGVCGAAGMTSLYFCIDRLPLADAVTLRFLNPAVTALAGWLILHERLGAQGAGGVLLSLVGLVVFTQPAFVFGGVPWSHTRVVGTLFGLSAAFLGAATVILIRILGKSEKPLVVALYFHICAVVSASVPLAFGFPAAAVLPSVPQWGLLFLVSCTSLAGQLLICRVLQLLTATKASALNFTQVLWSHAIGLVFLGETLSLLSLAGAAVLCAGVLLVTSVKSDEPKKAAAAPAAVQASVGELGALLPPAPSCGGKSEPAGGRRWLALPSWGASPAVAAVAGGGGGGGDGDEESASGGSCAELEQQRLLTTRLPSA